MRTNEGGKDTILLQNLAAADIEVPDDDEGPSTYYSFCVTSRYCGFQCLLH